MQFLHLFATVIVCITVIRGTVIHLPDNNGQTLDHYLCSDNLVVNDMMFILQSNVTHYSTERLELCVVKGANNITIMSDSNNSPAVLNCSRTGLAFIDVSNLNIYNTIFSGCGITLDEDSYNALNNVPANGIPYYKYDRNDSVTLLFLNCSHLALYNVHINNYIGFGMILTNTQGTIEMQYISITDAIDSSNYRDETQQLKVSGSALLITYDVQKLLENASMILDHVIVTDGYTTEFNDSLISDIDTRLSHPIVRVAGGISIIINEPDNTSFSANIKIENLTVKNNRGGGVVLVYINVVKSRVVIDTANISSCLLGGLNDQKKIGESLTVYFALTEMREGLQSCCSLLLENVNFTALIADSCRNKYGNLSVQPSVAFDLTSVLVRAIGDYVGKRNTKNYVQSVMLNNVYFAQDFPGITKREFGIGMFVISFKSIKMILQNVTSQGFSCSVNGYNPNDPYYSCERVGSLAFENMESLEIVNGLFSNHEQCSVMYVHSSDISFAGNITISHNCGIVYGAVNLLFTSKLMFVEPLKLTMENNSAVYGGALHIYEQFSDECAIKFRPKYHYDYQNYTNMNISLVINGNKAALSGNTIYANPLQMCVDGAQVPSNVSLFDLLLISMTPQQTRNTTEVASPPSSICLCKNGKIPELPCKEQMQKFNVSPGGSINFSMLAADIDVSVYGIATARFEMTTDVNVHLKQQDVSSSLAQGSCTEIEYTIYHDANAMSNVQLVLSPYLQTSSVSLDLTLKNCSSGFKHENGTCQCLPVYETLGCSNGLINRPDNDWIGYTTRDQHMNSTYGYASDCPSGLCNDRLKNTSIITNFDEPSPMCNGGRTGTLCTICPNGKSLVFGSVICQKCSNAYISTILFFCACGILLVAVLFMLQLTVKVGTINGLIFYANLFSSGLTLGYLLQVNSNLYLLRIFISFLNLDLGFPLCFYDGMTEEVYRLLQFVFPVYVWIIIGTIIIVSRHSTKLTKITGKHSVAVLATLIQLSYSKIITNVAESFPYTQIMTSKENYYTVWFVVGVKYGSHLHILQLIISIIFLLLFVVPYTLIITFAPFLARYQIISRFMPYLDTVYAPYKEKWRFWFGARLALLLFLLIFRALLSGVSFAISLGLELFLVLTFVLFQIHFKPFKSIIIHILDTFFMLNFCAIAIFAISISSGTTLFSISVTLTAVAFIVFISIILYHIYMVYFKKMISEKFNDLSAKPEFHLLETSEMHQSSAHQSPSHTQSIVGRVIIDKSAIFSDGLREPIMDYCDDVDKGDITH